MNILAIDQGTSSTTALVVAPGGEVLGAGRASLTPAPGPGGAVEQDPHELLESVLAAGRAALAQAGAPVAAVGLGNQGETVLRWDRSSGEPLGNAISWQDSARASVASGAGGPRRAAAADQRAAPGPLLRRSEDGVASAPGRVDGGVITTIDAWVTARLTGAFVTDAATASRTMLLDLAELGWSAQACGIFGLDPAQQPEISELRRGRRRDLRLRARACR